MLPRAGVAWMYPGYVEVTTIGDRRHPFSREAEAGEPEVGEPAAAPALDRQRRRRRAVRGRAQRLPDQRPRPRLAPPAPSRTGISHATIPAGRLGYPPHCHSAEEEIFVVLDGEGRSLLGDEEHAVRPGSVVGRPPGTRVAHAFRAGEADLVYLAYGTREPNDIAYYPRSGKVSLRGVGVMGRIEPLGYWDGEP